MKTAFTMYLNVLFPKLSFRFKNDTQIPACVFFLSFVNFILLYVAFASILLAFCLSVLLLCKQNKLRANSLNF